MKVIDSSSNHRAICLDANETLDSTTLIAALVASESANINRQQAAFMVNALLDALEEMNLARVAA